MTKCGRNLEMSSHNSSHRSRRERRLRSRSRHRSHSHHREHRERKGRERDEPSQIFHGELHERHRRSRSRSPLCTMVRGSEPSSSASRESDFAKLTEVLAGIVKIGSRKPHYIEKKLLPEFDPELSNLSASEWVQKVEMCGEMYDWDSKTKLYLAILKLKGNAKLWHDGLQSSLLTWEVFSLAMIRQFPGEENFGLLMEQAVNFKSAPGQDLQAYCFAKLGKINKLKLDLSEEKLANLIAQGIHDESIRTIVLAARNKTVADLNKCLSVFLNVDKAKEVKIQNLQKWINARFRIQENPRSITARAVLRAGRRDTLSVFVPNAKRTIPRTKI